ncbi:MAG: heavy-metal-associated domain-containing protein [Ignavibacteria bacterium]|nr:heavy-metal-associated domain-containing protein [Ignavibacteria bacterium]
MIHTYKVTGMTCGKCLATVKSTLSKIQEIQKADVTLDPPQAVITMSTHVPTVVMNKQLAAAGKYQLEETESMHHEMSAAVIGDSAIPIEKRSFFTAYKPILLVFGYLIGMTVLNEFTKSRFNLMSAMHLFMGGFFLLFSFFKLLDVKGFAYSYMSYDIIAKKWIGWGYIYPFIELSLGVAFLFHFAILEATIITLVVMSVSSIGVIQSLLAKKKIQCACLGTVFNLPMSNITLIEDLLMVLMAVAMLII